MTHRTTLSNIELREKAKTQLIRLAQKEWFSKIDLKSKNYSLKGLSPFFDEHALLRIGGRLRNSLDPASVKHPIILPKKCHLSYLLAKDVHDKHAHQGRNTNINYLRSSGIWITDCRSVVSSIINKCVHCIRLRGKGQRMADLHRRRSKVTKNELMVISCKLLHSLTSYLVPRYITIRDI